MKFYLIIAVLIVWGSAYWFGGQIAQKKCEARVVQNKTNEIIQTINVQRETDEKVYSTGVAGIRRILRTKYTIAE